VSQIGDVTQEYNMYTDSHTPNSVRADSNMNIVPPDSGKVNLVDRKLKYQSNQDPHIKSSSVLDDFDPAAYQYQTKAPIAAQAEIQFYSKDDALTNNTYGSTARRERRRLTRGAGATAAAGDDTSGMSPGTSADIKRQGRRRLRQQRFQEDS
jgi:hypothetical protein